MKILKLQRVPRYFGYVLLCAILFSCSNRPPENENENENISNVKDILIPINSVTRQGVQILTIDSCEYIWVKEDGGAGLTHKGNCKYCAERAKRSLK